MGDTDRHHEDHCCSRPLRRCRFGIHHHSAGPYSPLPPHDGQEPPTWLWQDCWRERSRPSFLSPPCFPPHDSLYVCGGNIFNENTIITAAHCADGARRVEITAGAHDQSVNEPTQQVVISTSHIEHPDWNSFTLQGDVAILYLDSPLEFSNEIGSIALASAEPAVGEPVNMAGWGKTCDQINCGVSDVVNEVT